MLSVAIRVNDCTYSTPTSYWLHLLEGADVQLLAVERSTAAFMAPPTRSTRNARSAQLRRLRYKQTHGWLVRSFHAIRSLFGRYRTATLFCY